MIKRSCCFVQQLLFHLAGLQHLTDITFSFKNKERIYKEILKGSITTKNIKKSVFYNKYLIEERLQCVQHLGNLIETNVVHYLINKNQFIRYTSIRADYLCEYERKSDIIYLFLVVVKNNPKFENECRGCSLFQKHNNNYVLGTSKTTTLLIEKIETGNHKIIFKNPSFKE